jgi:hypothetical protein
MKNISLKIESTRIRATLEPSNRLRASIEFHNYIPTSLNYVIILEDYFAEDYVIDYEV